MTESKLTYRNSDHIRRTSIVDTDRPGQITVYTEADMTQVVEDVKALRETHQAKATSSHTLLARAPMTVYEKSIIEEWDESDWNKWLNDPDNAAFRVYQGRV